MTSNAAHGIMVCACDHAAPLQKLVLVQVVQCMGTRQKILIRSDKPYLLVRARAPLQMHYEDSPFVIESLLYDPIATHLTSG